MAVALVVVNSLIILPVLFYRFDLMIFLILSVLLVFIFATAKFVVIVVNYSDDDCFGARLLIDSFLIPLRLFGRRRGDAETYTTRVAKSRNTTFVQHETRHEKGYLEEFS